MALGDSYTIGTGASDEANNFPSLLAAKLRESTGAAVEVTNPAVNGFTSEDLIRTELDDLKRVHPDLVSVLVGANDVVQGRRPDAYRRSLDTIYDAIERLRLPGGRVLSISMPDWSAAPAARLYGNPDSIRRQIEEFNAVARAESVKRNFLFADLSDLSRSRIGEPGWISEDDLHPGDLQYAVWADYLWALAGPGWVNAAAA